MSNDRDDIPLPATLGFVLGIGLVFLIGWFTLFALMAERW